MQLLDPGAPPPVLYPDTFSLSCKAKDLYEALRSVALNASKARGYCDAVTQVHFFCPGEIVAAALCMARSTMYRKLEELGAAGLVEARAHYITHDGRTKADGMVWAVKLYPERSGRIRVPYDALKVSYRCLSADIESGRTAWKQIGQSKELQEKRVEIKKILDWALPPQPTQTPDTLMTVRADLEQVLDVPYADRDDRRTTVDGAARALVVAFGDVGGLISTAGSCGSSCASQTLREPTTGIRSTNRLGVPRATQGKGSLKSRGPYSSPGLKAQLGGMG